MNTIRMTLIQAMVSLRFCHARIFPGLRVLLCSVAMHVAATGLSEASQPVLFKKSPVKLIDTGLENDEPYPGPNQAAYWLDDHRLVAGVTLGSAATDPKKIGRTVLYDLDTGKSRELMRYAKPICWDDITGNGGVVHYPNPDDVKATQLFRLRVDQNGALIEKKEGNASYIREPSCDIAKENDPALATRRMFRLKPGHGRIDLGLLRKRYEPPPILTKPDGTQLEMPAESHDGVPRYLSFLGKYQLNRGSSCHVRGRQCPPDIYLLDPSGDVTTLKIPRELMTMMPIQRVYVVKNGLLFSAQSKEQKEGYLLLRDGVLHELWRPGRPGFPSTHRTETWGLETVSPDGCKVAFMRGVRPGRVFVFDHCSIGK